MKRNPPCISFGKTISTARWSRSEEHTSELQSLRHLVCRLLLEKKSIPTPAHARRNGAIEVRPAVFHRQFVDHGDRLVADSHPGLGRSWTRPPFRSPSSGRESHQDHEPRTGRSFAGSDADARRGYCEHRRRRRKRGAARTRRESAARISPPRAHRDGGYRCLFGRNFIPWEPLVERRGQRLFPLFV